LYSQIFLRKVVEWACSLLKNAYQLADGVAKAGSETLPFKQHAENLGKETDDDEICSSRKCNALHCGQDIERGARVKQIEVPATIIHSDVRPIGRVRASA